MTTPTRRALGALALAALVLPAGVLPTGAEAQTRVTLKSAKAASSYYQMAVQLSEAVREGTDGAIDVTVEESQGSVQNVMEVRARGGDYVFTSPPVLIGLARDGRAMFEGRESPAFDTIRALFPIPSLTMHVVVREDSEVTTFADLAGKRILLGQGSFGAREGARYLELFGVAETVEVVDAELSNAVPALQNGRIDGFVTAGSFPAPNVIEAAASVDLRVLSFTDAQIAETGRTKLTIPAGTYEGQEEPITTTSLPVIAYATTAMDEDTAYRLTRSFWEVKAAMGEDARWWNGVTKDSMAAIEGPVHPGAVRYYEEAGVALTEAQRGEDG